MSDGKVERLDLAPKRNRPLSLWNPVDYLLLLYWALFFPQALRWSLERFGRSGIGTNQGRKEVAEALRQDPVQRLLIIQALVVVISATVIIAFTLDVAGVAIDWAGVALGVAFGVSAGVALGVAGHDALGVAFGLAFGLAGGVAVGVAIGVALSVAFGVAGGVALGGARVVAVGVAVGVAVDVAGGVAYGVAVVVTGSRALDWVIALLMVRHHWPSPGSRMVWLPLARVRHQLEQDLEQDWDTGVHNLNQVLAYSLQFIPAVAALRSTLARSSDSQLLRRTAALTSEPFDWQLLRFGSASLKNRLYREMIDRLFWIPRKWSDKWTARYPLDFSLDTPSRCACAGFWLWHDKGAKEAVEAFAGVQHLPHGRELYGIALAIADGLKARSLEDLSSWKDRLSWLQAIADSELRTGTLDAIRILRDVVSEASAAFHAKSALNRSAALGRAAAELQRLLETGGDRVPEPEWPLLQGLTEQWRTILVHAGGEAGYQVIREPTLNPYDGYSGLPVTGHTFVGRHNAIKQIETRWSTSNQLPVLILYGHRRMGKTSILRNLNQTTPANTLLVYLDMQDAGFVDHTGELLLDLAEALHKQTTAAGFDAGPPPDQDDYASLGKARLALNALLALLEVQMNEGHCLILAVDEFELIEEGIAEGRIDAKLLAYLRALNQRHRWLALIFGGLHTLDEMGRDYKNAFYGQTENIRVGYLSHDDAIGLITRPHPDFALEYPPALREQLYRLTFGQPYLLQRLCWELVNNWNERFLEQGAKTPRTLEPAVLEPVLNSDFYKAAEYYFDDVWSNVTDDERALMTRMAQREGGWTTGELIELEAGIDIDATLKLLKRHDVIIEDLDGIRFAAELLRRWVLRSHQPGR